MEDRAEREREREVDTIRVHNRSDVTGEIDRPGWNHTDGERDTRVLGPRTRNSPEMTVPRALFRQSAARFIANFRASITETMAANRCPCIPPCTSVRHRDPIESWSPIKWKARLRIIHTSLIHGKNFSFQLFSSSLKKKKPFLFLPFLLSPFFPLFLCFLKKRFLLFSPPPFFFREWQPFSRLFLIRDHSLGKLYYYFGGRKACCSPRLSRGREIIFHPRFNPFF